MIVSFLRRSSSSSKTARGSRGSQTGRFPVDAIVRPSFAGLLLLVTVLAAAPPPARANVILQYFESQWETIEKKLPDVFMAGYQGIWLPPPGKGDTGGYTVGYDVYDRFHLGSPSDRTLYGTEASFRQLIREMNKLGLQSYVDLVLNHNGFRDSSTPGFEASGGYPGFVTTLPEDVDGDFHGAYEGGLFNMRLAGLIDIAQEKNHLFIRHPVDPTDPRNIPNEPARAENRRFYPDRDLPANSLGIHPFNTQNPMAGDPVPENATGLLLRYVQWLLEDVGVTGFRIDAERHIPQWFFNNFFDATVFERGRRAINGAPTTPFSFGEDLTGDWGELSSYIRKDGFGNRDVLDFPLYFAMRDVFEAGGFGSMRNLEFASIDGSDGLAHDGSRGVQFVSSHDNGMGGNQNLPYALILTRPGYPIVYFNAREFGEGRDFPIPSRGDALGGDAGDLLVRLVDIHNEYARGDYRTRWIDDDTYVFERSNSLIVAINDRADSGFDTRTIQTDFRNVQLVELTGAATNPVVDPNDDIHDAVDVGGDGVITINVPRGSTGGQYHGLGFVMYGLANPVGTLTLSPVAQTLPPETPQQVPNNSVRRQTPIEVVAADSFTVTLQIDKNAGPAEDNALLRIDRWTDLDGDQQPFIAAGDFAGYENFQNASRSTEGGTGTYSSTLEAGALGLSEGIHYVSAVAFRPRPAEAPPCFNTFRKVIYVDRRPPEVALVYPSTTGHGDVTSAEYQVVLRSVDRTADSMHVFFDKPADFDFLGNVGSANRAARYDRDEFRFNWTGIAPGLHSITVVAFEPTGRSSVTRFEPIEAIMPEPPIVFGVDVDDGMSSVDFQPVPAEIATLSYPHDFVIRVDSSFRGGIGFPADYTVTLRVDGGTTLTAQPYNPSLLPPIGRLVQNDQNLGDQWDEFRFLWTNYEPGLHEFRARAQLAGSLWPNEVIATVLVPDQAQPPDFTILSPAPEPAPALVLTNPAQLSVQVQHDGTARSLRATIDFDGREELIGLVNDPPGQTVTITGALGTYWRDDVIQGLFALNGQNLPIRVTATTGLNGTGASRTKQTRVTIQGLPEAPAFPALEVDGDAADFIALADPLTVSPADGPLGGAAPADFGADGTLTEFYARIQDDTLYLGLRGDMFGEHNYKNASIIFIDVDAGAGTGATDMDRGGTQSGDDGTPSDLNDANLQDELRQNISDSGFRLSAALAAQGIGFDAAVGITGFDPLGAASFGFGSGGVPGSTTDFQYLGGQFAFTQGAGALPAAAGTFYAAPDFFEAAVPLVALGNPDPRDLRFAVVTTSDDGFPSPNCLPENASNSYTGGQVIEAVVALSEPAPLKINEVYTGVPDAVEIFNPTGEDVDLTGWRLSWTDSDSVSGWFDFPPGTSIEAGAYLIVEDRGHPGDNSRTRLFTGYNIPWAALRGGSAALLNVDGVAADFVRWGNANGSLQYTPAPPAGTAFAAGSPAGADGEGAGHSLARTQDSTDTDAPSDWEATSGADATSPTLHQRNLDPPAGVIAGSDFEGSDEGWSFHTAAPFTAPAADSQNGRLSMSWSEPGFTFGFWSSPLDFVEVFVDSLYRTTWRVSTDVSDPALVPTIRLRSTAQNFHQSDLLVVNSTGDAQRVPVPGGTDFVFWFQPPWSAIGRGEAGDDLSLNFDLLAFNPQDAASGTVRLEQVSVERVARSSLHAGWRTVRAFEFEGGAEGWAFVPIMPSDNLPVGDAAGGALRITSRINVLTFGFWNWAGAGVEMNAAGELWRATFWVSSNVSDPQTAPQLRLRMFRSDNQVAAVKSMLSAGDGALSPTVTGARPYEVYFYAQPGDAGRALGLGFDLANFDPSKRADGQFLLHAVRIEKQGGL